MDTKLKKSKGIISFICINLSVLAALIVVAIVPSLIAYYDDVKQVADSVNQPNYLNSKQLKEFVCNIVADSFMLAQNDASTEWLTNLAADKNMYIEVRSNNAVKLKSQHVSFVNAGIDTKLSEDYGAVFHFINGKMSAKINGNAINFYGDDLFEPDKNDLFLPGYYNFEASDLEKKVEVLVAVKADPMWYSVSNNTEGINYGYVYDLSQGFKALKALGIVLIITAVLTVAMLIAGCLLHKHKKLVDQFFAKIIKFIPLEFKAPCVLGLAVMWIQMFDYIGFRVDFAIMVSNNLLICLVISTIGIWLLAVDNKYNKPIYKQSVIYVIYQLIALPNVKKGVYRKQIRLTILSVASFVCALFCLVLTIVAFDSYSPLNVIVCLMLTAIFTAGCFFATKDVISICQNTGKLVEFLGQLSHGQSPQVPQVNDIEIQTAIDQLTGLEQTLQLSLQEQMKSEHMKIELIANVSHDIKTPLTSVISYIDLLKEETDLPTHVKEYITVLDEKSQRLKNMVQDIFEVSKAASGELTVEVVKLDLCRLIRQTLADSEDAIAQSGMVICESIPVEPCEIAADGNRMYRVYQNLISNALKYSLAGSRIHINVQAANGKAIVSIKNVSAQQLNDTVDFTQRFVRGDASRTDGGSGLGLSIASSFTTACGGKFYVETNADLFSAYTEFELAQE